MPPPADYRPQSGAAPVYPAGYPQGSYYLAPAALPYHPPTSSAAPAASGAAAPAGTQVAIPGPHPPPPNAAGAAYYYGGYPPYPYSAGRILAPIFALGVF